MSTMFAGVDIGSSSIKIAVAEYLGVHGSQREALHVLGAIDSPVEGVQKGVVTNVDDAVASLSSALEKAERLIGVPITRTALTIGTPQFLVQPSRGVVAVSKVNGEVRPEDVDRVIDAAQTITTPPNFELLHVLPRSFMVDGQADITDPVGMIGTRLEVDAEIVYAPASQIRNLTKVVYRTGCDINEVVFGVLANAEVILEKRQKEEGVALINIGYQTTSLAVYEEGNLLHAAVIPLGSNHITGDIAIGLRTSLEIAERVKCELGFPDPSTVNKREEILWADVGDATQEGGFSRKALAEIVQARVEEIFEFVDKELRHVDRSGLLPSGAVLTGGGSLSAGIDVIAKRVLRLPVVVSRRFNATIEVADDLPAAFFSQVLGLIVWSSANAAENRGMSGRLKRWATKFRATAKNFPGVRRLFSGR